MSFNTLGLSSELKKAIEDKGYVYPSDIQLQAIPSIIKGNDIMARAQTGTGKTAAFALPILRKVKYAQGEAPRALINKNRLTPSSEAILAANSDPLNCNLSLVIPLLGNSLITATK